jgi:hypothetical protein
MNILKRHRKLTIILLLLALLILSGCAGTIGGQPAQLTDAPTAAEILDRYVDVTGGEAAYAKLYNRVTRGTFEITQAGIRGEVTIYHARPHQMYTVLDLEGIGRQESGASGDVVWELSPMTGPRIKTGEEQQTSLRDGTFDRFVVWRELYPEAVYEGTEEIDGQPCHRVVLKPDGGSPQTFYFNQRSGLMVQASSEVVTPMGAISVDTYPDDYREVDGVLIPFTARVEIMGQSRSITTTSVEHNVKLEEDIFILPEEIQVLLDQGGS